MMKKICFAVMCVLLSVAILGFAPSKTQASDEVMARIEANDKFVYLDYLSDDPIIFGYSIHACYADDAPYVEKFENAATVDELNALKAEARIYYTEKSSEFAADLQLKDYSMCSPSKIHATVSYSYYTLEQFMERDFDILCADDRVVSVIVEPIDLNVIKPDIVRTLDPNSDEAKAQLEYYKQAREKVKE